jgi:hypothetical protein
MAETASAKRRVTEKLLTPIVAVGASAAAGYVAKKGPGFVENTVVPRLKEAARGAGNAAEKLPEKLPEKARAAVSGGGELAEQLTDKARDVVGGGAESNGETGGSGGQLSQDELSRRREERARHRAQRRRKAKK